MWQPQAAISTSHGMACKLPEAVRAEGDLSSYFSLSVEPSVAEVCKLL